MSGILKEYVDVAERILDEYESIIIGDKRNAKIKPNPNSIKEDNNIGVKPKKRLNKKERKRKFNQKK